MLFSDSVMERRLQKMATSIPLVNVMFRPGLSTFIRQWTRLVQMSCQIKYKSFWVSPFFKKATSSEAF